MNQESWWLVGLDTAHIQSYIFNSNKLRENVGASYLVAAATDSWALESLYDTLGPDRCNVLPNPWRIDPGPQIERDQDLLAEVLYAGGGNFVAVFKFEEDARRFFQEHSRKLLLDAPGLRAIFHAEPFNWHGDALSIKVGGQHNPKKGLEVDGLLDHLKKQRSIQPASHGLKGLGVSAKCVSTGLPAVAFNEDEQPIAAEVEAKRAAFELADDLLHDLLPKKGFTYPRDLDELGRTRDDTSYIAVVHADGNQMGDYISGIQGKFPTPNDNRDYINFMRNFSEGTKAAAQLAMQRTFDYLDAAIRDGEHGLGIYAPFGGQFISVDIKDSKGEKRLVYPLRPLVSGGDDMTFVCDGRLGIDLAVRYVEEFKHATHDSNQLKDGFTACAGVAIVKTHYPFARAYDLADELASSAKKLRHRTGLSAVDWHFTSTGLYGDLKTIRQREYEPRKNERLMMRPIFVEPEGDDLRNWHITNALRREFQEMWEEHRSKAKGLMQALRDGEAAAQAFDLRYIQEEAGLFLPDVADLHTTYGWFTRENVAYCGYYDALELMDLFISLEEAAGVKHHA